jgi:Tfp pilus assembly protein PilE
MKQTKGLALIEVLVITAILANLSAVLYPVFSQAKAAAQQTACLYNLKLLGTALAQHTQDYNGHYPYSIDNCPWLNLLNYSDPNNPTNAWQMQLNAYVKDPSTFT